MVKRLNRLSQLDMGGVIKNVHNELGQSLYVTQANSEVPTGYSKVVLTHNIEGSVTEAVFYAGTATQKTRVKVVADVAGSLNGTYWYLNNAENDPQFYVWFNVDGGGTDPNIADKCGIEIPINTNDPVQVVSQALATFVNNSEYFKAVNHGNDVVIVETLSAGQTTASADVSTGFAITTVHDGVTQRIKCITLPEDPSLRYVFNHAEGKFELFNTDINVTVSDGDPVDSPFILNIDAASSGTEYSFTLPENTKRYEMKLRQSATVQYSFVTGQTNTNYITMVRGTVHYEEGLKLSVAKTIYFEVNRDTTVLEVKYWT
jgi:hypothetical protein